MFEVQSLENICVVERTEQRIRELVIEILLTPDRIIQLKIWMPKSREERYAMYRYANTQFTLKVNEAVLDAMLGKKYTYGRFPQ